MSPVPPWNRLAIQEILVTVGRIVAAVGMQVEAKDLLLELQ